MYLFSQMATHFWLLFALAVAIAVARELRMELRRQRLVKRERKSPD